MRSNRTSNLMLIANAVLLAALVLGHLGASPLGSTVAEASAPPKIPMNAATQRQRMIVALDEMNRNSKASTATLEAVNKNLEASIELQRQLIRMLERGNATVKVSTRDTGDRRGRD